ncbi:unnamed protein product [Phytomonas sp. Hart1]|nr:unnamed protein product [Phytomonas sp. Hart1]|eukprot:CCW67638.1 unnamed protein product [Phytomonas sp. isolate Hart1]
MNPTDLSQPTAERTLSEAADTVLNPKQKEKLHESLITEQIEQSKYLRAHSEITEIIQIAIFRLLKDQPEDAVLYLSDLFANNDLELIVEKSRAELEERHRNARRRPSSPPP